MNSFERLNTTRLGTVAEQMLINEFCLNRGYTPMTPNIQGPHQIDCICTKKDSKTFGLEIKAKSRLNNWEATSIDTNDYLAYLQADYPVYLLIADLHPDEERVYGGWVHKLTPLPFTVTDGLTTFPLSGMTHYRALTSDELETLRAFENNNYL